MIGLADGPSGSRPTRRSTARHLPADTHSVASEDQTSDPSEAPRFSLTGFVCSWALLLAGIALLGAVVLIPAERAALAARNERNLALAKEQHLLERLDRYREALTELESSDQIALQGWRANQLNVLPQGRRPLSERPRTIPASGTTSVFASLEPDPVAPRRTEPIDSALARVASHGSMRLWAIALGTIMIFASVLPASAPRAS